MDPWESTSLTKLKCGKIHDQARPEIADRWEWLSRKETPEITRKEKSRVDTEVMNLVPAKALSCTVHHHCTRCTMLDGKAYSNITFTASTQRCFVCKATQSTFNNLDAMKNIEIDRNTLEFGLSPLHCWLRTMDFFLKLSYQLRVTTDGVVEEKVQMNWTGLQPK